MFGDRLFFADSTFFWEFCSRKTRFWIPFSFFLTNSYNKARCLTPWRKVRMCTYTYHLWVRTVFVFGEQMLMMRNHLERIGWIKQWINECESIGSRRTHTLPTNADADGSRHRFPPTCYLEEAKSHMHRWRVNSFDMRKIDTMDLHSRALDATCQSHIFITNLP